MGQSRSTGDNKKTPRITRGSWDDRIVANGRILGPPLPGQGWLAGLTPSLDAGFNIYAFSPLFKRCDEGGTAVAVGSRSLVRYNNYLLPDVPFWKRVFLLVIVENFLLSEDP